MTPSRLLLWLTLLALVLVVPACMDTRALRDELSAEYGRAYVGFTTQERDAMEVIFLASPFVERSDAERRTTARKVAEHVRDHYERYKTLNKVIVQFTPRKEITPDMSMDDAAARYTFTRAEL